MNNIKSCVIDYGLNNISSIKKVLDKLEVKYDVITEARDISCYTHILFPGVGAFQEAAKRLRQSKLKDQIVSAVSKGSNILGICLGMQLFFEGSDEFSSVGNEKGLELLKGKCLRLDKDISKNIYVPHVGWNELRIKRHGELLKGLDSGDEFYFVHSYRVVPERQDVISSTCFHGIEFVSTVEHTNIYGTQFHLEKSFNKGVMILKNFLDLN